MWVQGGVDFIFLFLGRADDTFSSLFFPTNTHHYGRQVTAVALWAEAPADIPHRGGGRAVAARRAAHREGGVLRPSPAAGRDEGDPLKNGPGEVLALRGRTADEARGEAAGAGGGDPRGALPTHHCAARAEGHAEAGVRHLGVARTTATFRRHRFRLLFLILVLVLVLVLVLLLLLPLLLLLLLRLGALPPSGRWRGGHHGHRPRVVRNNDDREQQPRAVHLPLVPRRVPVLPSVAEPADAVARLTDLKPRPTDRSSSRPPCRR